jgi:hypothetical protein
MTNEIEQQQPAEAVTDELASLKARADLMGIKYHPNVGVDKLRAKINNHLNKGPSSLDDDEDVTALQNKSKEYVSSKEFRDEEFRLRKQNAASLIRIRVTCMNPSKKDWDGEIISVGSARIGTFKKFVKFNTEDGWHVPFIIYQYLKERKFSSFYTEKDHMGQPVRKSKLVNEFSIEVLPALTKEELKELAIKQAMEAGKVE